MTDQLPATSTAEHIRTAFDLVGPAPGHLSAALHYLISNVVGPMHARLAELERRVSAEPDDGEPLRSPPLKNWRSLGKVIIVPAPASVGEEDEADKIARKFYVAKGSAYYNNYKRCAADGIARGRELERENQRTINQSRPDREWPSCGHTAVGTCFQCYVSRGEKIARLTAELSAERGTSEGRLKVLDEKADEARREWHRAENAESERDKLADDVQAWRAWALIAIPAGNPGVSIDCHALDAAQQVLFQRGLWPEPLHA